MVLTENFPAIGIRGRINQIEQEQEIIINSCNNDKLVDFW